MFCGKPVLYFRPNLEGLEHRLAPSANALWEGVEETLPDHYYEEPSELPAIMLDTEQVGYEPLSTDIQQLDAGILATHDYNSEFPDQDSIDLDDGVTEPARDEATDFVFINPEEVPLSFADMPNDTETVDLALEIQ